ncbi:MAG: class I tRNA ligase family protein [Patescibacteria group bacterium]
MEKSKKQASENTSLILFYVLSNSLKLLHPFLPFITEEVWSSFKSKSLLLIEKWPTK